MLKAVPELTVSTYLWGFKKHRWLFIFHFDHFALSVQQQTSVDSHLLVLPGISAHFCARPGTWNVWVPRLHSLIRKIFFSPTELANCSILPSFVPDGFSYSGLFVADVAAVALCPNLVLSIDLQSPLLVFAQPDWYQGCIDSVVTVSTSSSYCSGQYH